MKIKCCKCGFKHKRKVCLKCKHVCCRLGKTRVAEVCTRCKYFGMTKEEVHFRNIVPYAELNYSPEIDLTFVYLNEGVVYENNTK